MCDCCAILRKCVGREGRDAITNPHTETVSEMCFSRMTSCICTVDSRGAGSGHVLLQPRLERQLATWPALVAAASGHVTAPGTWWLTHSSVGLACCPLLALTMAACTSMG